MFLCLSIFFIFFLHIQKCLEIHQLSIIKIIMKVFKNAIERYQRLSLEEKEKSGNMVVSNTEIYQKIKKQ